MSQTLLEQAELFKVRKEPEFNEEHFELAVAFAQSKIGMSAACRALGINNHSSLVYSRLFMALRQGVKEGFIMINKIK